MIRAAHGASGPVAAPHPVRPRRGRGRTRVRRCARGRRHIRPVRPVRLVAGWGVPGTGRSGDSKRWPALIFHPPPRTPPAMKWRNDAISRMRWSRRAPERYAPATFLSPADALGQGGRGRRRPRPRSTTHRPTAFTAGSMRGPWVWVSGRGVRGGGSRWRACARWRCSGGRADRVRG